jgi:ABC-type transport system involved in cytochrome c biogenesis permease subunit
LAIALGGLYLLTAAMPAHVPAGRMNLAAFAELPVVDRGRVKPLDTVARVDLMVVSGRQVLRDADGKEVPAIKWLLDVLTSSRIFNNPAADREKVFRIDNDQLLGMLGLELRPGKYRYALDEFADKLDVLQREYARVRALDPKHRDVFDQKVSEVYEHYRVVEGLSDLDSLLMVPPDSPGQEWQTFLQALGHEPALKQALAEKQAKTPQQLLRSLRAQGKGYSPAIAWLAMLMAYADGNAEDFNRAVGEYRDQLDARMPGVVATARWEAFFNHFAPFYHCTVLYACVLGLVCLSWLVFTEPLRLAAFWLAVLTLVVHSAALLTRMAIQGRPPVTNLYSTAVFVGWCCLVMCLVLEWIFHNGFGSVVAAVLGFCTMLMANHLAGSGDTLEMMQAVLDTNFWLATHVTIINKGYAATLVAGGLGMLYILLGVFTPVLSQDRAKSLSQMIYGVVCYATLLSFTGTVLGGIWADQSWGRFWGWDPKENGALMIVLWNALILHARWGGVVKQRGVAVLAVAGNLVTLWSWHGTNQLGVGLHAYGFNKELVLILRWCWLAHLVVIGIGLLPRNRWASFVIAGSPVRRAQITRNGTPARVAPAEAAAGVAAGR